MDPQVFIIHDGTGSAGPESGSFLTQNRRGTGAELRHGSPKHTQDRRGRRRGRQSDGNKTRTGPEPAPKLYRELKLTLEPGPEDVFIKAEVRFRPAGCGSALENLQPGKERKNKKITEPSQGRERIILLPVPSFKIKPVFILLTH